MKGTFNYLINQKNTTNIQKYVPKKHFYWTSSARFGIQQLVKQNQRIGIPAFTCNVIPQSIKKAKGQIIYFDSGIIPDYNEIKKIIKDIDVLLIPYNMGFIPNIKQIQKLCKQNAVELIEDCGPAFGAKFNNEPVGLFSDKSVYSFGMSKGFFIGGLIATNTPIKYKKTKQYPISKIILTTLKGLSAQFWFNNNIYPFLEKLIHSELKTHYPLLEYKFPKYAKHIIIQQIKNYNKTLKRRRKNAELIIKELDGIINFVKPTINSQPSWLYFVFLDKNRTKLQKTLRDYNLDLIPSKTFYNLSNNPTYKKAEKTQEEQLIFALDRPKKEVIQLIKAIKKIKQENGPNKT